ncbi:MAG: glycosyltransferase family 4 protein [Candidatus Delongbacteria bacterium]|jgi:glycosyltransferase involved in cell wall biosynthesis|nr:glycosyltransferase family 4 protein [Candidatus Delongbacteria bacterium]
MKIRIITHAPFPEGLATTNRVFYHAKGLAANGVDVKIYIALPTERPESVANPAPTGNYKGIDFEYSGGETVRSRSSFRRKYNYLTFPIKAAIKALKDKPDAVVMISYSSVYVLLITKLIFLLAGMRFIVEETELPLIVNRNYGIYKLRNDFLKLFLFKNLDGFLVISYELKKIYSKLVSKKCPIVLIPVIVDVDDIYREGVPRTRNIVYTGPLHQKKDGILTIIKSFSAIAGEYPEVNLVCTGSIEHSADRDKVKEELAKSKFRDRIIMKGFVSRTEMIDLLNSAVCLVLAKPSSDQADTCFPTKLGEYLSTGNPIAVTSTGEIPLYLKDGENAYISEPDSVDSYTQKLRELLSDPDKAIRIGEEGKKVAGEKFNYKEIAKKVISLVENGK